jgi:hypothetical protein
MTDEKRFAPFLALLGSSGFAPRFVLPTGSSNDAESLTTMVQLLILIDG